MKIAELPKPGGKIICYTHGKGYVSLTAHPDGSMAPVLARGFLEHCSNITRRFGRYVYPVKLPRTPGALVLIYPWTDASKSFDTNPAESTIRAAAHSGGLPVNNKVMIRAFRRHKPEEIADVTCPPPSNILADTRMHCAGEVREHEEDRDLISRGDGV